MLKSFLSSYQFDANIHKVMKWFFTVSIQCLMHASHLLKTHFGLHNPLMTLSSLEIRNSWCLMPVLQVGACDGVTELDISKIWNDSIS